MRELLPRLHVFKTSNLNFAMCASASMILTPHDFIELCELRPHWYLTVFEDGCWDQLGACTIRASVESPTGM